jgi:hypothetical protein
VPSSGSSSSGSGAPSQSVLLRPSTSTPSVFGAWLADVVVTVLPTRNGPLARSTAGPAAALHALPNGRP